MNLIDLWAFEQQRGVKWTSRDGGERNAVRVGVDAKKGWDETYS